MTLKGRSDVPLPPGVTGYLERSGLVADRARVVPLTGDASDRRYFRVLTRDGGSIVLALHAAPFDVDALPFVNVARLLAQVPLPIPAILGHADDLGMLVAARISATSRCRPIWARRRPASTRRSTARPSDFIARAAAARPGARVGPVHPVRHRVRRREADLGAGVLRQALPRGLPRRRAPAGRRAALAEEWAPHRRGAGGRAARALPPRLPQPQPDAARRPALHHRLPGRADGAGHLRSRVAAARLVRRHRGRRGRRAHRATSWRSKGLRPAGRDAPEFRRRFDLMALQRNLKALGTFGYQTATRRNPVYIQYIPRTLRYARDQPGEVPALRPAARPAARLRRGAAVGARYSGLTGNLAGQDRPRRDIPNVPTGLRASRRRATPRPRPADRGGSRPGMRLQLQ